MAANVYFVDFRAQSSKRNLLSKLEMLFASAGLSSVVRTGDLCAIKVHFGELGNDAFLSPVYARKASDAVRAAGGKPFFADTNTLYSGSRHNAVGHLETAALHGYLPPVCGAPCIIADGLKGRDWREVELGAKWYKSVKIASGFADADSMVVLTHFKGHEMAGFGGAIKNLAMGCAPAAGKKEQHSVRFFVRSEKCVACGECVEVCPAGAARLEGSAASIDKEACIGCGECASRCQAKAISMDWATEIVPFTERLTEYALGAVKDKAGRVLYLNFVKDVVPECDCNPFSDAPLVADIGVLASTDPVAIDQASLDLVTAAPSAAGSATEGRAGPGDDKFAILHPETRGQVQLEYGEKIGLGSRAYELVKI